MDRRDKMGSWKPTMTMVGVVVVFAVMNTLTKMAFNQGMHTTVLITLRQLIATLFLAPIAYFRERASLTQWLFFLGLQYTTATFACAFINMTPIFTFLVALPCGLEKVEVKTGAGIAKVGGTVLGFSAAMILALYQGPSLTKQLRAAAAPSPAAMAAQRWAMGSVALLGGSACWSLWFILQSKIGSKYPALYSGTALMFLLSFLQMAAVALAVDKLTLSPWILTTKLQIITVLFVGIVGSGIGFLAMSWCVEQRGPVFTTAFTPLIQIIAAAINVIVLHEQLHLGTVIGSALVIVGLYLVLWGKSKEQQAMAPSSTSPAPNVLQPQQTTTTVHMQTA
ncbi:WAT1-related protein At3g30340-like isoform X2 [Oryza brachyantha]|uniref:WAT1-related protein At3g30340-like isoform X2 n=1 Tax=Oryza brachyantha TaxID=4533 RepID=UPI0007760DC5|nr:WAT1-related protein At3g30340-like isoform X2 [Oryza brachyantha]